MDDIMLPGSKPTETKPPMETKPIQTSEKKGGNKVLGILLALLLAAAVGGGVWYWQKTEKDKLQEKIDEQTAEISELKNDSSGASGIEKSESDDEAYVAPTAETISEAVTAEDYASLQPYMADTVNVIIAASEGLGPRTAAEAAGDLDYLSSGVAPWDFSIDEATLTEWRDNSYASYIPEGAIIGQASSDGPVVSFQLNAAGKITDIFMAVAGEIMAQ